jgi:hypothetical protein
MRRRVQFRAISGPAGTAQTAAAGASCLVRSGALGGTRTPNLLIRSLVLDVRSFWRSPFLQVRVHREMGLSRVPS